MRTAVDINNKFKLVSEMSNDATFQIVEYESLRGALDIKSAMGIKYLKDAGVRLKQVRILLEDSAVRVQAGALNYMRGDIEVRNKIGGPIGFGKKLFASKVTGESAIKPVFQGTGEIFLEPTFGYFALVELEDEEVIVDDGVFYACEETVDVSAAMQKSISSMVLGKEGLFQIKLKGNGIAVLQLPVPESEIIRCKLYQDRLVVDGDFAVLRTGNIHFTVEKSGTSLIGSAINGEGLVNVFSGTGEVWLLPTKYIYDDMKKLNITQEMYAKDQDFHE